MRCDRVQRHVWEALQVTSMDRKSHRPRFLYLVMNERVQDDGQFAIASGELQIASARHAAPRSSPAGKPKVPSRPPRAPVAMQVKRKCQEASPNPGRRSVQQEGRLQPVDQPRMPKTKEATRMTCCDCIHVIIWFPFLGTECRLASGNIYWVEEDSGGYLEGICNRWRTTHSSTEVAPPPCVS